VCFLKPGLAENFKYIRKQGMQLASKMRFISAQFNAYFRDDLWKKCATHSNSMAKFLEEKLVEINVSITQPVQSNGVFVILPYEVAESVRKKYFFYPWDEKKSEYRLMTSWDTTVEDIENFIAILKEELSKTT
jgi:threonine aldolase